MCSAAVGVIWEQRATLLQLWPPPPQLSKEKGSQLLGDLMEIVLSSKLLHPITASGGPRIPFQGLHFLILFWKASLQPFH